MALINQTDLEQRLNRSLTADEASAFTNINESLQSYVESVIGSSVEAVSATNRYFDGGVQHLTINPCTGITAVDLVDDDQVSVYTYDTTDYTNEPINKTLKRYLRHRPGPFQTGINNIRVNAKFSIYEDAGVLAQVKDAMLQALVSEVANTDNVKRESIEGYSLEYATTETKNALKQLTYLFPEI